MHHSMHQTNLLTFGVAIFFTWRSTAAMAATSVSDASAQKNQTATVISTKYGFVANKNTTPQQPQRFLSPN
jgi:hypothetical protein